MKLSKMLSSPVGLVVQGFAVGGLFFLVQPLSGGDPAPPSAPKGSVLSTLQV